MTVSKWRAFTHTQSTVASGQRVGHEQGSWDHVWSALPQHPLLMMQEVWSHPRHPPSSSTKYLWVNSRGWHFFDSTDWGQPSQKDENLSLFLRKLKTYVLKGCDDCFPENGARDPALDLSQVVFILPNAVKIKIISRNKPKKHTAVVFLTLTKT